MQINAMTPGSVAGMRASQRLLAGAMGHGFWCHGANRCSRYLCLRGHPATQNQSSARREAAEPVPVRRQSGAGGQHASYGGFTGQYQGLEALYAKYQSKGLVILDFPSNDFGKQEPGTNQEIADFCSNTYAVQFPMFTKTAVSDSGRNALFAELAQTTGTTPKWNFYKHLIDCHGKVVDSYSSFTSPNSHSLIADIEQAL